MTNQNNAAQPVLTDEEINAACDWPASNTTMRAENDRAMAREVEAAVLRKLSKLRAPVADERANVDTLARVLQTAWAKAEPDHSVTLNPTSYWSTFADMSRAALASAPVAGEALDTLTVILEWDDGNSDEIEVQGTEKMLRRLQVWLDRKRGLFHEPAPQASEAVRNALIPFAAMEESDLIGTAYEGKGDDAEILHFHRTGKSVTLGDFRRARTALSAQPGAQRTGGSDAE